MSERPTPENPGPESSGPGGTDPEQAAAGTHGHYETVGDDAAGHASPESSRGSGAPAPGYGSGYQGADPDDGSGYQGADAGYGSGDRGASSGYGTGGYGTGGYGSDGRGGYSPSSDVDYYSQGGSGASYGAQQAPVYRQPGSAQAQSQAQTAMILGIVGVVVTFIGVILGPIALSQAGKAERGGADATAGRVLGWIATILGGLVALFIILYIVFFVVVIGAAINSGY